MTNYSCIVLDFQILTLQLPLKQHLSFNQVLMFEIWCINWKYNLQPFDNTSAARFRIPKSTSMMIVGLDFYRSRGCCLTKCKILLLQIVQIQKLAFSKSDVEIWIQNTVINIHEDLMHWVLNYDFFIKVLY